MTTADRRYPLKLANEDSPWLYWSDFQVAPNFELLCNIFDIERKVATATIPASSQVIVIEEQSLRKSMAILNRMTGTSITNTRNTEILEHLIREVKDESSLHFAVTIVKDLNTQLVFSESDVSDASIDITPKLNQLNATREQVLTHTLSLFLYLYYFYILSNVKNKEKMNNY
ncbi:hypothetical protein RFI_31807 [Reticulomyxa filosa]|uniref:Uncharacterized protein n=1 Tax=Reticulomyxa filosa TaxID=46433 RepID=X6LVD7_RETFI|nr:hypothetical protein RFI_31807 [Reticulomyxa filosa]|eukprot:ETO05589.1 hypothetical protein RFI_31807 [Reticulomyxa filosa]